MKEAVSSNMLVPVYQMPSTTSQRTIILKLKAYAVLHNGTETNVKPREINTEFTSNYPVTSSSRQNWTLSDLL
jgi:hypothetical protein